MAKIKLPITSGTQPASKQPGIPTVANQAQPPAATTNKIVPYGAIGITPKGEPYYGTGIDGWLRKVGANLFDPNKLVTGTTPDPTNPAKSIKLLEKYGYIAPTFNVQPGQILTEEQQEAKALAEKQQLNNIDFSEWMNIVKDDPGIMLREAGAFLKGSFFAFGDAMQLAERYTFRKFFTIPIATALDARIRELYPNTTPWERIKKFMPYSDMVYSAWIDSTKREEYIRAVISGENPTFAVERIANPWIEFAGSFIFDPLWLVPSGKAGTGINAVDDFTKIASRGLDDAARAARTLKDTQKSGEVITNLIKAYDDLRDARNAGVITRSTFKRGLGNLFQETQAAKASIMTGRTNEVMGFILRQEGRNPEKVAEVIKDMVMAGSKDPAIKANALLSLFNRGYSNVLFSPSGMDAQLFLQKFSNGDLLNTAKKIFENSGDVDKLEKFVTETMKHVVDSSFPSVNDLEKAYRLVETAKDLKNIPQHMIEMAEQWKNISPFVKKITRFDDALQKGVFGVGYKSINRFFAGIYMGMSPGYAMRNLINGTVHILADAGAGTAARAFGGGIKGFIGEALLGRPAMRLFKKSIDDITDAGGDVIHSRALSGQGIFGQILEKKEASGRVAGAIEKITSVGLTSGQASEKAMGLQIWGHTFLREMDKAMRSGAIPSIDNLVKAGMNEGVARNLVEKLINNRGNVGKTMMEFRSALRNGKKIDLWKTMPMSRYLKGFLDARSVNMYDSYMDMVNGNYSSKEELIEAGEKWIREWVKDLRKSVSGNAPVVSQSEDVMAPISRLEDTVEELAKQDIKFDEDARHTFMEMVQTQANANALNLEAIQALQKGIITKLDQLGIPVRVAQETSLSFGKKVTEMTDAIRSTYFDLVDKTWAISNGLKVDGDTQSALVRLQNLSASMNYAPPKFDFTDITSFKKGMWEEWFRQAGKDHYYHFSQGYYKALFKEGIQPLIDASGGKLRLETLADLRKFLKQIDDTPNGTFSDAIMHNINQAIDNIEYASKLNTSTTIRDASGLDAVLKPQTTMQEVAAFMPHLKNIFRKYMKVVVGDADKTDEYLELVDEGSKGIARIPQDIRESIITLWKDSRRMRQEAAETTARAESKVARTTATTAVTNLPGVPVTEAAAKIEEVLPKVVKRGDTITNSMRRRLTGLGFTGSDIESMSAREAWYALDANLSLRNVPKRGRKVQIKLPDAETVRSMAEQFIKDHIPLMVGSEGVVNVSAVVNENAHDVARQMVSLLREHRTEDLAKVFHNAIGVFSRTGKRFREGADAKNIAQELFRMYFNAIKNESVDEAKLIARAIDSTGVTDASWKLSRFTKDIFSPAIDNVTEEIFTRISRAAARPTNEQLTFQASKVADWVSTHASPSVDMAADVVDGKLRLRAKLRPGGRENLDTYIQEILEQSDAAGVDVILDFVGMQVKRDADWYRGLGFEYQRGPKQFVRLAPPSKNNIVIGAPVQAVRNISGTRNTPGAEQALQFISRMQKRGAGSGFSIGDFDSTMMEGLRKFARPGETDQQVFDRLLSSSMKDIIGEQIDIAKMATQMYETTLMNSYPVLGAKSDPQSIINSILRNSSDSPSAVYDKLTDLEKQVIDDISTNYNLSIDDVIGAIRKENGIDPAGVPAEQFKNIPALVDEIPDVNEDTLREALGLDRDATIEEINSIHPNARPPEQVPTVHQATLEQANYARLEIEMDLRKRASMFGQTMNIDSNAVIETALTKWEDDATRYISDARAHAQRYADNARDFALLNYEDKMYIDKALAYIFPYHFWYGRTYVNWMKRIYNNPIILASYVKYRKMLETMHAGLPEWWKYNLSTNDLPGLESDNPLYFNLEASFNSLNNITGVDFNDPNKRVNWWSKTIDDFSKFGPTLWTPINWLVAAGLYAQGEEDAATRWAGRLVPQTATVKSLMYKLGVNMPGVKYNELDPFVLAFSGGLDPIERRRVGRALGGMVDSGLYTNEVALEAAHSQSGQVWEDAVAMASGARSTANLASFFLGVGMKPRTAQDMEIDKFYTEYNGLWQMRDAVSEEVFTESMRQLQEKYPFMDVLLLSRKPTEQRDSAYAYNVLSRIPPGQKSELADVAHIGDLMDMFYTTKGDFTKWTEPDRDRFMSGILNMGAVLKCPDDSLRREYWQASDLYKQMNTAMEKEFGSDINNKISIYYSYEPGSQERQDYKELHPELDAAFQFKNQYILSNKVLNKYYGGISVIEQYYSSQVRSTLDGEFPGIDQVFAEYDELQLQDSRAARAYKNSHPEMSAYSKRQKALEDEMMRRIAELAKLFPEQPQVPLRADQPPASQSQQDIVEAVQPERQMTWADFQQVLSPAMQQLVMDYITNGKEISYQGKSQLDYLASRMGFYDGDELLQQIMIAVARGQ